MRIRNLGIALILFVIVVIVLALYTDILGFESELSIDNSEFKKIMSAQKEAEKEPYYLTSKRLIDYSDVI